MNKEIDIHFMYIDLDVCTRCIGTDESLDTALSQVQDVLAAAGVQVVVRKTLVETVEQARALRFESSPTIRVNDRDIALELRESRCASCESQSSNGPVDCRVWVFNGEEHTEAPPAMIVDAVLRAIYGESGARTNEPDEYSDVTENLKRFFAGRDGEVTAGESACCSPSEQEACCEPSEKESCCEGATSAQCGCN